MPRRSFSRRVPVLLWIESILAISMFMIGLALAGVYLGGVQVYPPDRNLG